MVWGGVLRGSIGGFCSSGCEESAIKGQGLRLCRAYGVFMTV